MLGYVAVHWILWNVWVKDIVSGKYAGGDICRMGYVYGSRMPRQDVRTLPLQHIEANEYDGRPIDVLTIGDSFSNSGFVGENGCYQDYIATLSKCSVLNVLPMPYTIRPGADPVGTLIKLYHAGYLDRVKPKSIVLESVERSTIQRLGYFVDFDVTATNAALKEHLDTKVNGFRPMTTNVFINDGNFKFVANNLYYYPIYGRNIDTTVFRRKLSKPCFSVQRPDQLIYYFEDMSSIPLATPEAVNQMNTHLNRLADMLAAKGIKLYFMPVVDKSNLYRDYVIGKPYNKSVFFEQLRPLPKRYQFIDTKAILSEEVKNGTKDVYYPDDTHWSWHASEAIFKRVHFEK